MNESLADRYRRIPYAEFVHSHTHPAHVGAVARLFGANSADPGSARILELATGRGSNLNWIAKSLPNAECLGVDLVTDGIEFARQVATQHGLGNVTFEAGDLLETDFGQRQFDYVIAHGFMAWTPEPVQQRILEVCRDHLGAGGVALVSYNAMPGSATRDALRRLFLLEMEQSSESADANQQLDVMDDVMKFFEATLPSVDTMAHTAELKQSLEVLRAKPREVLLHDEGGVVSEPLYLLQFTQWASETGLAYVADTDLTLDLLTLLPPPVRQEIAVRQMSRLKALQYVDYLRNCSFRSSIVCSARDRETILSQPNPASLLKLHVQSRFVVTGPVSVSDDSPVTFELSGQPFAASSPKDSPVTISNPLMKAVLHDLMDSRERPVLFGESWNRVQQQLQTSLNDAALAAVTQFLLEAVCLGRIKLTLEKEF